MNHTFIHTYTHQAKKIAGYKGQLGLHTSRAVAVKTQKKRLQTKLLNLKDTHQKAENDKQKLQRRLDDQVCE